MEKISKLTPEQEAQIPNYFKMGLEIGYNCEPLDRKRAENIITKLYDLAGLSKPQFLFMGSPLGCIIACHFLDSFNRKVNTKPGDRQRSKRLADILDYTIDQFKKQTEDDTPADVYQAFCVHMEKERHGILTNASALSHLGAQLSNYYGAQHCVSWAILHKYCKEVLKVEYTEEQQGQMERWIEQAQACNWWFPYNGLVICSERHNELHVREDGSLHRDEGPAVLYPDGFAVFHLNGVEMAEEHVMTRAEELDPKMILKVTNVEQRRELIRKAGVERFLDNLPHKELDKEGNYTLLSVDLSEEYTDKKYLKMLNPSIGVWHVEAVPDECTTVEQALHLRKPEEMRKIPVSPDGADWYQQGDVCIWPRNATALKPRPSKLT